MSHKSKSPKPCKVGSEKINPCCDRKKDKACHFKDNINFDQMRKEHDLYKFLEKKLQKHKNDILNSLSEEEIDLLQHVKNMREDWLNKYYRPECRKCDNKGINHDGYLRYLNRHYNNVTRKNTRYAKTRSYDRETRSQSRGRNRKRKGGRSKKRKRH